MGFVAELSTLEDGLIVMLETILKILVVDASKRPNAAQLLKLLVHVKDHVSSSRLNETRFCTVLDRVEENSVIQGTPARDTLFTGVIPRRPVSHTSVTHRNPAIGPFIRIVNRDATFEQDVIHEVARQAIDTTPEDHPDRAGRLDNLGVRLASFFHKAVYQEDA